MRLVLTIFMLLVWGLWFGGLVTLFISVQALFGQDRAVAMQAAPMLFVAFEQYQFGLAAAGLVVFGIWSLLLRRPVAVVGFALVGATVLLAVLSGVWITPALEALRLEGLGESEAFRRPHGWSMLVYVSQTVILLATGILVAIVTSRGNRGRSRA